MKNTILLLPLMIFFLSITNAQEFNWVAKVGGTDYDTAEDIAFDNAGNIYTVGTFNGSADFNPSGSGTYNLTSAGAEDAYLVKLDTGKNFLWAIKVGGSQADFAYTVDVTDSNAVYICGKFKGTVDFNPGAGVDNRTSAGDFDIFILKLNASGSFIRVKTIGSTGADVVESCTVDQGQNILLCGVFAGTVDFDPNTGTAFLTSTGSQDAYVLKLSTGGIYIWAKKFGSSQGEFAYGIKTDAAGSVYVCGKFTGTVDFNPGASTFELTASGFGADVYTFKWDWIGGFVWAISMGGINNDNAYDLALDNSDNPVVTGVFSATADFDPDLSETFNLISAGGEDIFVAKYSSYDGSLVFAKGMGGNQSDAGYSIVLDPTENIFITGLFASTADFDPDAGIFDLSSAGSSDSYILYLDVSGNFVWAGAIGASESDNGNAINVSGESEVYSAGTFSYIVDFDPGSGVYLDTAYSLYSNDAYLLRLYFCDPPVTSITVNLCPGDSVYAGGAYQTLPGTYYDYYTDPNGCSSTVITTVQFLFSVELGNPVAACIGDVVSLDATVTGATYLWNTGATTPNISVTQSGNYSVTVTKNGCTQSDLVNVTFHSLPIVNLGSNTGFCQGNSISLNAGNSGSSYSWSTGAITQSITVSTTNNYSVTVTNTYGCVASDDVSITVFPNPVVDLGQNVSLCQGNSVTLNAGNDGTVYQWSNSETTSQINVSTTGNYSVTVTNQNACSTNDQIMVTVNPLPIVIANVSNDSICTGDQITLYGSGASSYSWSNGVSDNVPFTPTSSNDYSVIGTDVNGCVNGNNILSTVHPLPVLPTISINEYVLTSSSSSGNQWCINGAPINGAIAQTHTCTQYGFYQVIVSNDLLCTNVSDSSYVDYVGFGKIGFEDLEIVNYPNPFYSTTLLQFNLEETSDLGLIIYNMVGEKVLEVPSQKMNAGKQQLEISLPQSVSGMLVYELNVNGGVAIGKMVKE